VDTRVREFKIESIVGTDADENEVIYSRLERNNVLLLSKALIIVDYL
jgi:hypothetical protein